METSVAFIYSMLLYSKISSQHTFIQSFLSLLFGLYHKELIFLSSFNIKWCFINKVREDHAQIIILISTGGAHSVYQLN